MRGACGDGSIFGPVPSRRLGLSLGIDLVPYKTCTFDCIYCQLGHTTSLTMRRGSYKDAAGILGEIKKRLEKKGRIDWITISGSGEPTLYAGIGRIIRGIRKISRIPVAVITNGSLLSRAAVRRALYAADLVIPGIDAGEENVFRRLHRPAEGLKLKNVIDGLSEFAAHYRGRLWIEVMLVKGVNDSPGSLDKISSLIRNIKPELVHLNTVVRPGAYPAARPLSNMDLRSAEQRMKMNLKQTPVHVIAPYCARNSRTAGGNSEDMVIGYLKRRPGTMTDLSEGTGLKAVQVRGALTRLMRRRLVKKQRFGGKTFYRAS